MDVATKAKAALVSRFSGTCDRKGYTRTIQENLMPGVDLATVENDLRRGDGNEMTTKLRAVHSSAALAVNCFARFKNRPDDIAILGEQGARQVEFEKKLPIFRGGRAPNIDVWIERDRYGVAVESKLLEYLKPTAPLFSRAYERLAPPESGPAWWHVYKDAKEGVPQHLNRAQLVKHYFGLNALWKKSHQSPQLTLLYIFWEPLNWAEVDECKRHREQLSAFAEALSVAEIGFRWMTYNQLWDEWAAIPALAAHASNLKARYQLSL
jgi:hypothetical protein